MIVRAIGFASLPLVAALGIMQQSLEGTFAFVLLLGVLITIHEFGHFAVAKLCGVKVLKFSIGFGSPLGFGKWRMRWQRGETEYVVAWIPVGGFVKMLGENPDEEDGPEAKAEPERALNNRPTWQKLAVVAAGPVMNLIFPIFILAVILAIGIPQRLPVVGHVEVNSPAAQAGLRAGDRILSVAGKPVQWWDDMLSDVAEREGQTVEIGVDREGVTQTLPVVVGGRSGLDPFNALHRVGWIGAEHDMLPSVLAIQEDSAAYRAGLRSGDRVEALDGVEVDRWSRVDEVLRSVAPGTPVNFRLERKGEQVECHLEANGSAEALGIGPAVVLVRSVSPGSAAAEAGITTGDLLIAVDGRPLEGFSALRDMVLTGEGKPMSITFARKGVSHQVTLTPHLTDSEVVEGIKEQLYLIGISGEDVGVEGAFGTEIVRNPFRSIPRATKMTIDITHSFLVGLGKIFSGEISPNQLGGPLRIAEEAHRAFQSGWDRYLRLMILISINLGILNLLPIPVLDGGQAVIFTAEGIFGPLSPRIKERLQGAGLALLVLLMGFAFWNDLSRYSAMLMEWMRSG